ncbi:AAA family ATPase [Marinospirillum perlucidum]|uniref:AAA family ATPase n=1 Tax=Marinospirillum perlucidum TaxID=1982602 RepID=UPI000DF2B62A|nr:AAA family ATPase [Marinospirillum perlucidum]
MPSREPSLSSAEDNSSEILQRLESINDQAVFYPGRQHGKHLDLLLHLSRYSNLLLTITGPSGSGKSHLKNRLQEQLDSGVTAVSLDANKVSQGPKLLSSLETALRLEIPPRADNRQYLEEIRNYTELLTEDGGSCLILIDNAEALDQGALDVVLELATTSNDSRRPHLALFGQEDLLKRLHDRSNQPRFEAVGHHLPLEAFGEVEARGYLEHRCHSVGLDHLPLNDDQFHRVYKASHGWPGLLNKALLQELENTGASEDTSAPVTPEPKKAAPNKKKKRNKTPLWPLLGGAVLLAGILVGFLYFDDVGNTSMSTTGMSLISRSQEIRQDSQSGPRGQSEEVLDRLENRVQDLPPPDTESLEPTPEPSTTEAPEPREEAPAPTQEAAQADTPDATPPPPVEGAQPDSPDDRPPAVTESSPEPEPQAETQPLDTPDALPPETAGNEEAAPEEQAPAETSEPEVSVEPEPEPEPEPQVATPRWQDQGHRREAWLMARDPGHFTLQMLASSEEAIANDFIDNQNTPDDFVYYRRGLASSPWVVVYGDFANRDAAEAARSALPAALRDQQPWLRPFSSIQEDLRTR